MRAANFVAIFLALTFVCAGIATAASRAEFDQLVQQIQAKPTDTKLREHVIAMAAELKPAPAVPEEARRKFVAASAIAKSAKDASGQKLAIKRYQEALKIAPWWGDAYYNLALAQELAGQFDGAISSLKLYILTKPSDKEAREAQDRIYALEGKADLAKADAANAATPAQQAKHGPKAPASADATAAAAAAAQQDAFLRSLDGAEFRYESTIPNDQGGMTVMSVYLLRISGRQATYSEQVVINPEAGIDAASCELNGASCELLPAMAGCQRTITASSDGRSATVRTVCGRPGFVPISRTLVRQN